MTDGPALLAAPRTPGLDEATLLADTPWLDIARTTLPAPLRPDARFAVLDVSEYFADVSGGVRTYLLQKARYVEARPDLRQVLVVPGAHDAIGSLSGVRCYRLHGPLIPTQKTYRFMLATRSMARIVAHERPDVIEVGSAYTAPWLIDRCTDELDVPAVWFYHSNLPRVVAPKGSRSSRLRRVGARLAARYVRSISRTVQVTIASSEFVERELRAFGVERIARVPLGVDAELFHPRRQAARAEARARAGLPAGPLVLYAGRLSLEKDLGTVVRGWADVERRTGATLACVGAGPDEAKLRAMAAGRRIVFLPFERDRETLADLYAAADLVVSPGPTETFGLAALEAMASGVPVLSCDQAGVAETVGRSGAGAQFASSDPASFAEACVRLLQADLPALGAIGRAYVEEHHRWDRVFDRLFEVYAGVAGR